MEDEKETVRIENFIHAGRKLRASIRETDAIWTTIVVYNDQDRPTKLLTVKTKALKHA